MAKKVKIKKTPKKRVKPVADETGRFICPTCKVLMCDCECEIDPFVPIIKKVKRAYKKGVK